jgi:hypothetical protein
MTESFSINSPLAQDQTKPFYMYQIRYSHTNSARYTYKSHARRQLGFYSLQKTFQAIKVLFLPKPQTDIKYSQVPQSFLFTLLALLLHLLLTIQDLYHALDAGITRLLIAFNLHNPLLTMADAPPDPNPDHEAAHPPAAHPAAPATTPHTGHRNSHRRPRRRDRDPGYCGGDRKKWTYTFVILVAIIMLLLGLVVWFGVGKGKF